MSNPWFRLYAEFSTDPKIQMLSEALQRRFIMLLCFKCNNDVTLQDDAAAFQLRITDIEWQETKAVFMAKGFIDEHNNILHWNKRQYISDSSSARVKRHRDKRKEQGLSRQNFIKKSTREIIFSRDESRCIYCDSKEDLTLDHAIPESRGGSNSIDNLNTACRSCNAAKRDLTHQEYCERNGLVTLLKRPQKQNTDTDTETETEKITPKGVTLAQKLAALKHPDKLMTFVAYAQEHQVKCDVSAELERFTQYCLCGKGKYVNHTAAFNNWLLNRKEFNNETTRRSSTQPQNKVERANAATRRAIENFGFTPRPAVPSEVGENPASIILEP